MDSLVGDEPFLAISRELPSFAGFYFNEHDQIVVALTDVSDLDVAAGLIRPWLGSHQPTGGFVARPVEHPLLELARYRTALQGRVFAIPGVVALGVDESDNRVNIGIAELAAEQAVRTLLSTLGVPEEAVIFRQTSYPVETSHWLRGSAPAIQGGWQISFWNGTQEKSCTLGFPAVRSNGDEVFVTNSHCTTDPHSYDGNWIRQPQTPYGIIGYEVLDPPLRACSSGSGSDCRAADAALISADVSMDLGTIARTTWRDGDEGDSGSLQVDHGNPTLTITGRNDHVFENETLHKIGRTTGWTYGAVESTCDDVDVDGWVKECSDRVDYHSDHGDSGAPVFYLNPDGTVELRGINYGRNWFFADARMSDLNQIEEDLGPLLVIEAPLSVKINGMTLVPPNTMVQWCADREGGRPPYSFEWRRNGSFVSTSECFLNNTGYSDFTLEVEVTDGRSDVASDTHFVNVEDTGTESVDTIPVERQTSDK